MAERPGLAQAASQHDRTMDDQAPRDGPTRREAVSGGTLAQAAGLLPVNGREYPADRRSWPPVLATALWQNRLAVLLAVTMTAVLVNLLFIAEWDRKWHTAHAHTVTARTRGDGAAATAASPAAALPQQGSPIRRPARAWLVTVLATAIVVLGAITALVSVSRTEARPPVAAAQPQALFAKPADGGDPYVNKCGADEQRLEYRNVYWPDHKLYGWLELYHSHICNASWGYVFGPNSVRWQVTIVARRLPDNTVAPSTINANDPPNSWGNVLSTLPGACVRVEAYITVDAIRGPVAVTSCQPDRLSGGVAPPPTPPPAPPSQYTAASPGKQGSPNGR
jgi:hypothetical protein